MQTSDSRRTSCYATMQCDSKCKYKNAKGEHDVREIWRNEFIHRNQ